MEKLKFDKILQDHKEWLSDCSKGKRADLRNANLSDANLRNADLRNANLRNANLSDANLGGANLGYADLRNANLRNADLRNANLRNANLGGANLRNANLGYADLRNANLSDANLGGANLGGANLGNANLSDANLGYADLGNANLSDANLPYFENIPQSSSFIAWKKCADGCLVKLEIPAKAKRTSNLRNRKCRAEYVKVVKIWDNENKPIKECTGSYDGSTIYEVGKITKPDKYCDDIRLDCSHGIHFFITEREAKEW